MSAQKASSFRSSSYRRYQPTTSSRFPGYRQTASGVWVERDEWESEVPEEAWSQKRG
jgi:hypothetical protein